MLELKEQHAIARNFSTRVHCRILSLAVKPVRVIHLKSVEVVDQASEEELVVVL